MSSSKGEKVRRRILQAIFQFTSSNDAPPTIQDIKEITGIRSFDVIGRHVKTLKKEGLVEWDNISNKILITESCLISQIFNQEANHA